MTMTENLYGLPEGRVPVMRVPASSKDTNFAGDIFGGWIMSQVDIAGSIPAMLHAKGRVVTVAVKSMTFIVPVYVGDIANIYAEIQSVGRTSITVDMDVYVQRNPAEPKCLLISRACFVYVAVDEDGRPRPVVSS